MNHNYESLSYPFIEIVFSNQENHFHEREVLYDEYLDVDSIEFPSTRNRLDLDPSIDSSSVPSIPPVDKKNLTCSDASDLQVSNKNHLNISMETCHGTVSFPCLPSEKSNHVNKGWYLNSLSKFDNRFYNHVHTTNNCP